MTSALPSVLALNGGSSSIRFAVYAAEATPQWLLAGKIDRIGQRGTTLNIRLPTGVAAPPLRLTATDHHAGVAVLLDWLAAQPVWATVRGVGHRVVHGLRHTAPERITPRLLADLRRLTAFDPEHLPRELALIAALQQRYPRLPQVACFDTAFHRTMPAVARRLPLPRRFARQGLERYGFHGLSYAYLLEELTRLSPAAAQGRVILAHLGNGASLAALHHGRSIDTSMGFTPAAGLMMSTRAGDLDPGLGYYLATTAGLSAAGFQRLVNHESGLLGVSGTSGDVRDLLARESRDPRAAEALELFCYQARKWLGAYAAALGGLDTLVFAGGIGENAPPIRDRICAHLGFLGLTLHAGRNARSAAVISTAASRVTVRVLRTDEEHMIARSVCRVLKLLPLPSPPIAETAPVSPVARRTWPKEFIHVRAPN